MPDNTSAGAFADFALHLGSLTTTAKVVEALETAGSAVLGRGEVSLLLYARRQFVLAGATDQSLAEATSGQLDLGEGPSFDAVHSSGAVTCADLSTAEQWPRWRASASALGWRSWLSLPLISRGDRRLGVLNVASRRTGEVDAALARRAWILAAHLAVALDTVQMEENLLRAQEAHMQVGQAVGLLMERYQLDADQAFSVLRRYSQDRQVKLRDVAADLLATRRLPGVAER